MINIRGDISLLDTAILTKGAHIAKNGTCARELIHLVVTGKHDDVTPACMTETLSVLPILNDGPWESDQERTEFFRPWLRKLLQCPRDKERDLRRLYKLADFAVRMAQSTFPIAIVDKKTAAEAARAAEAAWAAAFKIHANEILRIIVETE